MRKTKDFISLLDFLWSIAVIGHRALWVEGCDNACNALTLATSQDRPGLVLVAEASKVSW